MRTCADCDSCSARSNDVSAGVCAATAVGMLARSCAGSLRSPCTMKMFCATSACAVRSLNSTWSTRVSPFALARAYRLALMFSLVASKLRPRSASSRAALVDLREKRVVAVPGQKITASFAHALGITQHVLLETALRQDWFSSG